MSQIVFIDEDELKELQIYKNILYVEKLSPLNKYDSRLYNSIR